MSQAQKLQQSFDLLQKSLGELEFGPPVTHVLNPQSYAREPMRLYLERYLCGPPGRTLLLGMNPGPWGMAQTGVPFGEIDSVKDWLNISGQVQKPEGEHPKRPIQGFECKRSEVSGRRLWGFFREQFPNPADFANRFLVFNYCPLIFLEESGRNRTPDKLPKAEREALLEACDHCLRNVLEILEVKRALGVGKFAEKRLLQIQKDLPELEEVDSILPPSPASPAANRGWAEAVQNKLLARK